MDNVFVEVIGRIHPALFNILVVFIFIGAVVALVYIVPRIRWDKNNKPYIYNRGYEVNKGRMKDLERSIKRLELQMLFYNAPGAVRVINEQYDKYKDMGGNSYINDMYEHWKGGTLHAKVLSARMDD